MNPFQLGVGAISGANQAAQDFLSSRVGEVKKFLTGQSNPSDYLGAATYAVKLPAKPGVALGTAMIQSAGRPGARPMNSLGIGGDAPVYNTPFNQTGLSDYEARVQ